MAIMKLRRVYAVENGQYSYYRRIENCHQQLNAMAANSGISRHWRCELTF